MSSTQEYKQLKIRIGAQPINWSNDDFQKLGGTTPLETCLSEMSLAGYSGAELGHKFPRDPEVLKPLLAAHKLVLVSGWHSSYLGTRDAEGERTSFQKHLEFLGAMGCEVAIIAECSHRIYHDSRQPLDWRRASDPFSAVEWKKLFHGLDEFAGLAADRGIKLAYHHHIGTVIQSAAEIDRLMDGTQALGLLCDTGHLALAGANPLETVRRYASRVVHVHLKDVREPVAVRAREEGWPFERAVREGVFTVPGDGSLAYGPIFETLAEANYSGWWVVEAEQDPAIANPLEYARRGRAEIRRITGL